MKAQLIQNLQKRFDAFEVLAATLTQASLNEKANLPKHKSLGEHFWCIIGARESYTRAIQAGAWQGFACSLQELETESIQQALRESSVAFQKMILNCECKSAERITLLLALYEHEVMHEGQMIRHLYALERPIPDALRWA